jgi:hypothetical protein
MVSPKLWRALPNSRIVAHLPQNQTFVGRGFANFFTVKGAVFIAFSIP